MPASATAVYLPANARPPQGGAMTLSRLNFTRGKVVLQGASATCVANSKRPHWRKIMHIAAKAIIVTTGVVGLVGSALAADLTGPEIKAFLSGKTVYLETTTASASRPRCDLLGRGWNGPLQDSRRRYVAWQMGNQGQYELH